MKNLILSVFSVILLSCHPVAASAEVIDNNLNNTGLQLTLCEEIADYYRDWETDRKSTRLNSCHSAKSRMPSSA